MITGVLKLYWSYYEVVILKHIWSRDIRAQFSFNKY